MFHTGRRANGVRGGVQRRLYGQVRQKSGGNSTKRGFAAAAQAVARAADLRARTAVGIRNVLHDLA